MTQQPPPPGYGSDPGMVPLAGARPAGLQDRFLARLIDFVIVGVTFSILDGILVGGIIGGVAGSGDGARFVGAIVSSILGVAAFVGYYAYLESSRGQTVGKMVMKLRTIDAQGSDPTLEQALRRNAFMALGVLGFLAANLLSIIPVVGWILGSAISLAAGVGQLVGVITIAVGISNDTVNRRAWHDHFARETQVLKIG